MRSPFPGMDPYLESHWGDVHARLVLYIANALQPMLPRDLRARVQERVFVDAPFGAERSIYPDVHVMQQAKRRKRRPSSNVRAAVADPIILALDDEPVTEHFLEIREAGNGGRVITVIEVSRSNKQPGEGRELYRRKQRELRAASVNLVEIDLLRGGERVFVILPDRIPMSDRTPYHVCVWRADRFNDVEVYRVPLRERLPLIGIPLRSEDDDVPLDLQAVLDECYATGGYDDLDYSKPPDPPLDADHTKWAAGLLGRKRGRCRN